MSLCPSCPSIVNIINAASPNTVQNISYFLFLIPSYGSDKTKKVPQQDAELIYLF